MHEIDAELPGGIHKKTEEINRKAEKNAITFKRGRELEGDSLKS